MPLGGGGAVLSPTVNEAQVNVPDPVITVVIPPLLLLWSCITPPTTVSVAPEFMVKVIVLPLLSPNSIEATVAEAVNVGWFEV